MDEETINCKILLFMFLCQFVVICMGTLSMTLVAISHLNIYIKMLIFSLVTLLTFKLEKSLFLWCFDSACGVFLNNNSNLSYQNHQNEDSNNGSIARSEISLDVIRDETNNNINSDIKSSMKQRVINKPDIETESENLNYII
jgi:hypothetical protein